MILGKGIFIEKVDFKWEWLSSRSLLPPLPFVRSSSLPARPLQSFLLLSTSSTGIALPEHWPHTAFMGREYQQIGENEARKGLGAGLKGQNWPLSLPKNWKMLPGPAWAYRARVPAPVWKRPHSRASQGTIPASSRCEEALGAWQHPAALLPG